MKMVYDGVTDVVVYLKVVRPFHKKKELQRVRTMNKTWNCPNITVRQLNDRFLLLADS